LDVDRLAKVAREVLAAAPGIVALRAELRRDGPDFDPAYREVTRSEANDLVADVALIEPRLVRVLAEVVRQMDASPYLDGRPASRLLPLLAEFVADADGGSV
jgi:hypothetical protein